MAAVLLFLLMQPYFMWHSVFNTPQSKAILTFILCSLFFKNRECNDSRLGFLLISFFLLIFFYVSMNGYNWLYSLTFIPLAYLPFANIKYQKDVYNNFLSLYSVIIGLSLIVWALVLMGVVPSMSTIAPLNAIKRYNYTVYPLLVRANDSFRFFGLFDEPGIIGTVSGLILCINKFSFKDKRNFIILISGLCSLSFFFYGLIAVYFICYYVFVEKKIKKALLIAFSVIVAYLVIVNTPFFNDILGSRFEWDASSGSFAGDNRLNEKGKDFFASIIGTDAFWWGIDDKESYRELVAGSSSYINTIVLNGVVFFALYLFFWIVYAFKLKTTYANFVLFVFVLFGTIYQRPFMFTVEFIFLWSTLAKLNFKK